MTREELRCSECALASQRADHADGDQELSEVVEWPDKQVRHRALSHWAHAREDEQVRCREQHRAVPDPHAREIAGPRCCGHPAKRQRVEGDLGLPGQAEGQRRNADQQRDGGSLVLRVQIRAAVAQVERDGDHVPGEKRQRAAREVRFQHHVTQSAERHHQRDAVRITHRVVSPCINTQQAHACAFPQDQVEPRNPAVRHEPVADARDQAGQQPWALFDQGALRHRIPYPSGLFPRACRAGDAMPMRLS